MNDFYILDIFCVANEIYCFENATSSMCFVHDAISEKEPVLHSHDTSG
jgi:hypothetical protein